MSSLAIQLVVILAMVAVSVIICVTVSAALNSSNSSGGGGSSSSATGPTGKSVIGPAGNTGPPGGSVSASSTGSTGPTGFLGPTGLANPDTLTNTGPTGGFGATGVGGTQGDQGPTGVQAYSWTVGIASLRSGGDAFATGDCATIYGPRSNAYNGSLGIWLCASFNWGPIDPLPSAGVIDVDIPFIGTPIRTQWPLMSFFTNNSGKQVIGRAALGSQNLIQIFLTDPAGLAAPAPMVLADLLNGMGELAGGGAVVTSYYPTQ